MIHTVRLYPENCLSQSKAMRICRIESSSKVLVDYPLLCSMLSDFGDCGGEELQNP